MRILVTGANGQLGSELRELSVNSNDVFLFTDIQELDLCDASQIDLFLTNNQVDTIINCAAYTAVDKAERETDIAQRVNAIAVKNIVDKSIKYDIKLIHVSTDYVFSGQHFKPIQEDDIVSPLGVYGKTKREGEKYILESDVKGVVIRTSWLYSSYGNNFVKSMIRLGNEREELGVIFDQVGTPTYAKDLAEAILFINNNGDIGKENKLFHYSNEGVASWYDFAKAIMEDGKINCDVKPIETKDYPTFAERPFYSVMSKNLIKSKFDIQIPYWRDSLKKCIHKIKNS